ncbi:odorant receptor 4-like [Achroia grisella]|uniref:odorant receptor 4-like n=1 Tax=Achroia grisella TaxID=688607 RepID=UPI0027D2F16A|nr:odorant receptor 4-like [Achroia grisella]
MDYFLYTTCTYIKLQFNILKTKFELLFTPSNSISQNTDDVITPAEFPAKFKELVTWHQKLIKAVDMLEYIFTKATLYNISASSLMICLTLFNATIIKDTALVLSFFVFLCVTYLQIYFLCYFGNIISDSSVGIADGVYNSKWYMMDAAIGRHLILVMMRSQKPCKLTAFGFTDIDLNVFMRILSNAWSYFALLKTFYP